MKHGPLGFALLMTVGLAAAPHAQAPTPGKEPGTLRVRLLGTIGGPTINAQRLGISFRHPRAARRGREVLGGGNPGDSSRHPRGVVYESNGVRVTAFSVDHRPVTPSFGYRLDYAGYSVVISGDTRPSANLVKFARGTDVLIHEIGPWKNDPVLSGPPDELIPGTNVTRRQRTIIAEHHTDAEQVGVVFDKVKPRLAVLSHYAPNANILPLLRKAYAGPIELSEDELTIDIGASINVVRFTPPRSGPGSAPDPRTSRSRH